jgi:hypothetical protein
MRRARPIVRNFSVAEFDSWVADCTGSQGILDLIRAYASQKWEDIFIPADSQLRVKRRAIELMTKLKETTVTIDKARWETDGYRLWSEMSQ